MKFGLIFGDLKERGPYFPIFLQRHISSLVYGKFQTIFYSQKKKNLRFLMMFMQEKWKFFIKEWNWDMKCADGKEDRSRIQKN